jgi:multidrug efflux pump subunit AcrA (membrane-fusion protein)
MVSLRPEPEEEERLALAPLVETLPLTVQSGALGILASGTVQPREEVSVGAQVSGRIIYVNPSFQEGAVVADGAPLFRIDPADFRNRVRSAEADVAAQNVGVLQAEEEVAIAEDELRQFEAFAGTGSASEAMIDGNDYAARIRPPESLANGASPALARLADTAPNRLATREPQLQSARAALDRAAANLADAQLALSRTTVRSPFRGLVRSETAALGTLVQPGQTLGTILATDAYEVRVSLTEREAALIPGLLGSRGARPPATVSFDFGGRTWEWDAYVDRADSVLDAETRTIDVFIRVPDPLTSARPASGSAGDASAPPLLVGSFVNVTMNGQSPEPYISVPVAALRPGNEIWLAQDGQLRIIEARVIQRTDRVARLALPADADGARLITSALRAPVDGMAVRLASDTPPASQADPESADE